MEFFNENNTFFYNGDPRTKGYPLMSSPKYMIGCVLVYLLVVFLLKAIMKNRQPFELRSFLMLYNLVQVVGTFYMFYELFTVALLSNYSLACEPVNYSNEELPMRMQHVHWLYFMSKLVDFIDTIVFALRKKDNQITFLHVFHHATIVPYSWIAAKYFPGGQSFFACMLNSLVHTIMYSYYGLAALGPRVQKYLWWKRYITMIQLMQFFAVIIHSFVNLFQPSCSFPKSFVVSYTIYTFMIAGLFLDFYSKSYTNKQKKGFSSSSSSSTKGVKSN